MLKIADWITEEAVHEAESRMILSHVTELMRNKSVSETEALRLLGIESDRYEKAKLVGLS